MTGDSAGRPRPDSPTIPVTPPKLPRSASTSTTETTTRPLSKQAPSALALWKQRENESKQPPTRLPPPARHSTKRVMSAEIQRICSKFVEQAPPGELKNVISDITALVPQSGFVEQLAPAHKTHNEEQFEIINIPDKPDLKLILSKHNSLPGGKYFDLASELSYNVDHVSKTVSDISKYVPEGDNVELAKSIAKSLEKHAAEHYSNAATGVFPIAGGKIAILLVANKYSPNNYWNGRWRNEYIYTPSSSTLSGTLKVDVHYYEDGNVRLQTQKDISASVSPSASAIVKEISEAEQEYHQALNKGFVDIQEETFKSLRRYLPITRQKMDWDKVSGYRMGQEIGGGSSR